MNSFTKEPSQQLEKSKEEKNSVMCLDNISLCKNGFGWKVSRTDSRNRIYSLYGSGLHTNRSFARTVWHKREKGFYFFLSKRHAESYAKSCNEFRKAEVILMRYRKLIRVGTQRGRERAAVAEEIFFPKTSKKGKAVRCMKKQRVY